MKNYIVLMRPKHYMKNLLIFLAILYSGKLFHGKDFLVTISAFLSFCFMASAVYVQNDISDVEKDRNHPRKKERPVAKGLIQIQNAKIFCGMLMILSILIQFILYKTYLLSYEGFLASIGFLMLYFILNIFYSKYGKNIPVIDIILLAVGFLIRVYYGGAIINTPISDWLYLTVLSFSLYLAIGKRRGEIIHKKNQTREVLKYYTKEFLDKTMYVFLALTLVFYALWCSIGNHTKANTNMIYSTFIVIFITLRYSLIVESGSDADPVEVLCKDKMLIGGIFLYAIYMGVILYV